MINLFDGADSASGSSASASASGSEYSSQTVVRSFGRDTSAVSSHADVLIGSAFDKCRDESMKPENFRKSLEMRVTSELQVTPDDQLLLSPYGRDDGICEQSGKKVKFSSDASVEFSVRKTASGLHPLAVQASSEKPNENILKNTFSSAKVLFANLEKLNLLFETIEQCNKLSITTQVGLLAEIFEENKSSLSNEIMKLYQAVNSGSFEIQDGFKADLSKFIEDADAAFGVKPIKTNPLNTLGYDNITETGHVDLGNGEEEEEENEFAEIIRDYDEKAKDRERMLSDYLVLNDEKDEGGEEEAEYQRFLDKLKEREKRYENFKPEEIDLRAGDELGDVYNGYTPPGIDFGYLFGYEYNCKNTEEQEALYFHENRQDILAAILDKVDWMVYFAVKCNFYTVGVRLSEVVIQEKGIFSGQARQEDVEQYLLEMCNEKLSGEAKMTTDQLRVVDFCVEPESGV